MVGLKKRGQISSIDAFIAIILFVMLFISLRGVWLNNMNVSSKKIIALEMQVSAQQAIDVLTKSGGYPADWESENVSIIGLANKPFVLDSQKVALFESMDYSLVKEKLGLQGYDFVFDLNSSLPGLNKSIGASIDNNKTIFQLTRNTVYAGGDAVVTFNVFTK